jgi:hypothetical protein
VLAHFRGRTLLRVPMLPFVMPTLVAGPACWRCSARTASAG